MEQKSSLFGDSAVLSRKFTFMPQTVEDNSKSYTFNPNYGDGIKGVEELIKAIRSGIDVSIIAYSKRVHRGHWLALSKFLMEYDGVELVPVLWTNTKLPENSEWNVQKTIKYRNYEEELEAFRERYSGKTLLMIPLSTDRQKEVLRKLPDCDGYPQLVCGSYYNDPIIRTKEHYSCKSIFIIDLLRSGEAYLYMAPYHLYTHPWWR